MTPSPVPPRRPVTVTIGGLAGVGTSTLARGLRDRLGLPYTYAGQIFRDEASRRGLTLAEFGALCEQDPVVDRSIDDVQVALLRGGGVVLEGRLAGWLAHHHGLAARTVWVVCDDDERLRRLVDRDGGDVDEQRRRTRSREASEAQRFRAYYGADLADTSIYDLVLDSTATAPQDLVETVAAAVTSTP